MQRPRPSHWLAIGLLFAPGLCAGPQAWAQGVTATVIEPPPRPQIINRPQPSPNAPPHEADGGPQRRAQPLAVDGSPAEPAAGDAPVDGVLEPPEPEPVLDGGNPLARDHRPADDADAFERPPAGFDATAFAIETEPILDRRPRQLFRFEPYRPTGIRIGGFVALPEIEVGVGWSSNVLRSRPARDDTFFDMRPSLRFVSDWRRHAAELSASGDISTFNDLTSEDDRAYAIDARGRLDVTRRTAVSALAGRSLAQESRSALDAPTAASERADIVTTRAALTLDHRFNRLSVQLRGGVSDVDYGPVATAGGGVVSNRDRDVVTTQQAVRVSWELRPALVVFGEIALNQRRFAAPAESDGLSRDSTGERYRTGLAFDAAGRRLAGEVAVGWAVQRPEAAGLETVDGLVLDANLAVLVSPFTTMLLSARSDISDTSTAGSPGALSRQAGVELRHAFRRHLIATAGLGVAAQSYEGAGIREREITTTLGLEYYLSRAAVVFSRYQHTAFDSSEAGRDYDDDTLRVGVRLRR